MRHKRFLALTPLLILFAGGIFVRTIRDSIPLVASMPTSFSGIPEDVQTGVYNNLEVPVPVINPREPVSGVLGTANPSEKWIEVDLSEQKLKAWDGETLFIETLVSTGLPWWPTPTGEFRIWIKLRATRMRGGEGRYYYNLPNVPYVMFFANEKVPNWRGYGLHGTYWHDDFGTPRSHGCVNLPTPIAEQLYYWVAPELPAGVSTVYASVTNPGTRIVIHD